MDVRGQGVNHITDSPVCCGRLLIYRRSLLRCNTFRISSVWAQSVYEMRIPLSFGTLSFGKVVVGEVEEERMKMGEVHISGFG